MTRGSILESVVVLRNRYRAANKMEKGKILDEFVKVTGYHRKAAIRVLLNTPKRTGGRRGQPAGYSAVLQPLRAIWEASDRLCSKRLQPVIPGVGGRRSLSTTSPRNLLKNSIPIRAFADWQENKPGFGEAHLYEVSCLQEE